LAIASDTEELAGAVSGAGSFSLSTENEPLLVIAPDTLRVNWTPFVGPWVVGFKV
jgi:hypothetical protein